MSGPSAAASRSNNDDEQRGGVPLPTNEEEWIRYIEESSRVDGRLPSVVSIFRVPGKLMEGSKHRGACVPKRVSLGPYHHRRSAGLAAVEQHKPRALSRMMERFNRHHRRPNNMDFAVRARTAIVEVQELIKNNYDGKVEDEGEILATILTLDGCFILEIMRVFVSEMPDEAYDPLFESKRLLHVDHDLLADILKLENQIPLIVLQKLLKLELQQDDVTDTLCRIVLRFLLIFYPFGNEVKAYVDDSHLLSVFKQRLLLEDQGHHLLDFFRTLVVFARIGDAGNNSVSIDVVNTGGEHAQYTMLSNKWDDDAVDGERERKSHSPRCSLCLCFCQLPCWLCTRIVSLFSHNGGKDEYSAAPGIPHAVYLANAGIKFKKCVGGIKDIYFEPKSATMYLPSLIVNDSTELAFLNLMAFELQKRFKINYVANYMYLMKKLMVSEEDVLLLKREGVVSNYRGPDKEVAELFNNISKGIVIDSKDLMDGLQGQVMVHISSKSSRYRAALYKRWKTVGVGAATLLLVLTFLQTVVTLLTLFK